MRIEALRKAAGREEIDYQFLLSALSEYSKPRNKIHHWLKSGELIRVKKGLYVFGKEAALEPYSQEILANLIYGPSAISLTTALSLHGLIPERVSVITSITTKRNKNFITPAGQFVYHYLPSPKYAIGIEFAAVSNRQYLIATPEKALCDQIYLIDKSVPLKSSQDAEAYLFYDLRIDESGLAEMKIEKLKNINRFYKNKKINTLINFLEKWSK